MFGSLGAPELLFILGLALLIFGPSKMPEMGRTLGKAMAEFRKAANDFKRTLNAEAIEREMREADPRRAVNDTLAKAKRDLDGVLNPEEPSKESLSEKPESDESAEAQNSDEDRQGATGTVARGTGAGKAAE